MEKCSAFRGHEKGQIREIGAIKGHEKGGLAGVDVHISMT
jgi:hypothetical protein